MKCQKLLLSVAIGCLLLGASSVAMAQTVGCPDGIIAGQQVDEIVINGQSCFIEDTEVEGNVTITDSPNLDMIDVGVGGTVLITGVEGAQNNATIVRVDVFGGDLQVEQQVKAIVNAIVLRAGGGAGTGNLRVNNNASAVIRTNIVGGDLTCTDNLALDESFNRVFGTKNCQ